MQKGRFSTGESTVELSIALQQEKHKQNADCQMQSADCIADVFDSAEEYFQNAARISGRKAMSGNTKALT